MIFFFLPHILFEDSYTGNSYHEEKKICPIKQLYWDGYAVDFLKKYIIVLGISQLLTQRSITINSLRISSCVWLFLLYFFLILYAVQLLPQLCTSYRSTHPRCYSNRITDSYCDRFYLSCIHLPAEIPAADESTTTTADLQHVFSTWLDSWRKREADKPTQQIPASNIPKTWRIPPTCLNTYIDSF